MLGVNIYHTVILTVEHLFKISLLRLYSGRIYRAVPVTGNGNALNVVNQRSSGEIAGTVKADLIQAIREKAGLGMGNADTVLWCNNLYFKTVIANQPRQAFKEVPVSFRERSLQMLNISKVEEGNIFFAYADCYCLSVFFGEYVVDDKPHFASVI